MAALKVLIVEDDPLVALDLAEIVKSHAGAEVRMSASAREAARLGTAFDIALLDIDVADGKTYAFARDLLARQVPFAFVSGSKPADMPPDLRGAPFIPKPYEARDIRRLIDTCGTVAVPV